MKTRQLPFSKLALAARGTLALATLLLGACSTFIVHPKPSADAVQRSGQVQFISATENIVGEIVIRHDEKTFLAEITKGPGVRLLTLSAEFGIDPKLISVPEKHMLVVRATGPLSHGGWIWKPGKVTKKNYSAKALKDPSRAWSALPEVYMWGASKAKGESYRVCLPEIVMDVRAKNGEPARLRYARVETDGVYHLFNGAADRPPDWSVTTLPPKPTQKLASLLLIGPNFGKANPLKLEAVSCELAE